MQCLCGYDMIDLIKCDDFIILIWNLIVHILSSLSDIHYIRLIKTLRTVKIVVTKWGNCPFIMYNFLTYIMQFPFWKRVEPKLNWWTTRKKEVFFNTQNLLLLSGGRRSRGYIVSFMAYESILLLPLIFPHLLSWSPLSPASMSLSLYLYSIFPCVNLNGHCCETLVKWNWKRLNIIFLRILFLLILLTCREKKGERVEGRTGVKWEKE